MSRLKPDAFELAVAGAIGEPLEIEVEGLTGLAEIGHGITLNAETEFIGCFQGGKGRLRHELFVHGPEGATALNPDVAGAQPIPKNRQCRDLVQPAIRLGVCEDQLTALGAEVADRHSLRQGTASAGIQGLERPDCGQQRVMLRDERNVNISRNRAVYLRMVL